MVFFVCDACGETLKKKQVLAHTFKCKECRFSCMDCQAVFDKKSYEEHIKCISEDQKYGGANYIPKINKVCQKESEWHFIKSELKPFIKWKSY
jgi:cell growth-regulating nucleolar protein